MGLDAFEDFDEVEIPDMNPQPKAGEGPKGAPPVVDTLDEDLFDFPLPDLSHLEATVPDPEPEPEPPAAVEPAPVLPTVAVGDTLSASELDEDLFQFPDVFSGALLATPLEGDTPEAGEAEQQPESSTVDPVPATPQPEARPQVTPIPAPDVHFTPEPQVQPSQEAPVPAATAPVQEPATISAQAAKFEGRTPAQPAFDTAAQRQGYQRYIPPSADELAATAVPAGARSRLTEILAVGFLLLNVGLILFAYQANTSFHDTLTEVTRSIAETMNNSRPRAQETSPTISFPLPPVTQDPRNQFPGETVNLRLQSMSLARRMVEEERYMDARRVLYRLLANRDLAVLETSFVAEAEYLIAESYELQGKALAELEQ